MGKGAAFGFGQLQGMVVGLVVIGAEEHDLSPELPRPRDLDQWRALGHHDLGVDAKPRAVVCDGLRVVAGRRRDDPATALLLGQRHQLVASAPFLERSCELKVL